MILRSPETDSERPNVHAWDLKSGHSRVGQYQSTPGRVVTRDRLRAAACPRQRMEGREVLECVAHRVHRLTVGGLGEDDHRQCHRTNHTKTNPRDARRRHDCRICITCNTCDNQHQDCANTDIPTTAIFASRAAQCATGCNLGKHAIARRSAPQTSSSQAWLLCSDTFQ